MKHGHLLFQLALSCSFLQLLIFCDELVCLLLFLLFSLLHSQEKREKKQFFFWISLSLPSVALKNSWPFLLFPNSVNTYQLSHSLCLASLAFPILFFFSLKVPFFYIIFGVIIAFCDSVSVLVWYLRGKFIGFPGFYLVRI